jgi:hypothetical protein
MNAADTVSAIPVAQNLATIESIEHAVGQALDLATHLQNLEDTTLNVSSKAALAHASDLVLDTVACMCKAGAILRRDGR